MENQENSWARFETEENDHNLSFRKFFKHDNIPGSELHSPRNSSPGEFFEFELPSPLPDTIFCKEDDEVEDCLNEYEKRDYLTVLKSNSFSRSSPSTTTQDALLSKDEVGSIRYSYSSKQSPANSYHVQKVNITSLTSMSDKSRRRMFMFGMVKFEPEMELNAIKERQGRRVPATIFPVPDGGMPVIGGGSRKTAGSRNRSKIMRSIKGTAHFATVLARSFASIPVSMAGMVTQKY